MTSTNILDSRYVTAAALAYTVLSQTANPRKQPKIHHHHDEDDDKSLEPIPNMIEDHPPRTPPPRKIRIKPADVTIHTPETCSMSDIEMSLGSPGSFSKISSPPVHKKEAAVPRVSAATLRQVQSRRRIRSAMEHYQVEHSKHDPKPIVPRATSPPYITTTRKEEEHHEGGKPPSVISCSPNHQIRFKVHVENYSMVMRFQCEPCYASIRQHVAQRLTGKEKFTVKYRDADDDWCVIADTDDVLDALQEARRQHHQKNAQGSLLVRLVVEQQEAPTLADSLWQTMGSISTNYFGW